MSVYLMSTGEYSDYRIEDLMEGPDSFDLDRAAQQWWAQRPVDRKTGTPGTRLPLSRYSDSDLSAEFRKWLCDNHGFRQMEYKEFNSDDCLVTTPGQ